jgi:hypothetical protein
VPNGAFVVDAVLLMGVEPIFHPKVKEDKLVTIQKSLVQPKFSTSPSNIGFSYLVF